MKGGGGGGASRYSTQLIDGEGEFNSSGLKSFTEDAKLISQSGNSYTLISIMGPQSSGKSTLLNHLFQTNFVEMNAHKGRSQTTLGVWLAKCENVQHCTLVMDLEGNDGRERGDNDTSFEKQIALFALAVSDVVLINMWCHDVGREKAANKPLLRTAFQVMMRLFKPRQTTLLFVLRDKTQTPFSKLEQILNNDTIEIWNSIPKPQSRKETKFSEFFNIKVVALSSYEEEMEEYLGQVSELREQLSSGELMSSESEQLVPALGFSISAEQIWNTIRANKDLNIPPPSVMIAKVRCEEIAREKLEAFLANDEWCELSDQAMSNTNPEYSDFGNKTTSLIDACLQQYDEDAQLYENDIREERREMLFDNLMLRIKPVYDTALQVIINEKVKEFKDAFDNDLKSGRKSFRDVADNCKERYSSEFDQAFEDISIPEANWESSLDKEKFLNEIKTIVDGARGGKLNDLMHEYKEKLMDRTREALEVILGNPGSQTWPNIRELLQRESKEVASEYYKAMSELLGTNEEDDEDEDDDDDETNSIDHQDIQTQFEGYLKEIILVKAKTESTKVLNLMQDRFITMFLQDSDSMPRSWNEDDIDIDKIIRVAKTQCLKILSAMAAIQLESGRNNGDHEIEDILCSALLGDEEDERPSYGALANTNWNGISKENTLLSPIKCASTWKQFLTKINQITSLARKTIKDAKREAEIKQIPPPEPFNLFGLIGSVAKMVLPEIVPIINALGATANAVNQVQLDRAKYKVQKAEYKIQKAELNRGKKKKKQYHVVKEAEISEEEEDQEEEEDNEE